MPPDNTSGPDAKQVALTKEMVGLTEKLSRLQREQLRSQGEFLTQIEKKAISSSMELKIQQDLVAALTEQKKAKEEIAVQEKARLDLTREVEGLQQKLIAIQNDSTSAAGAEEEVRNRIAAKWRQYSASIERSQKIQKQAQKDINDLFQNQIESIEENFKLSKAQKKELKEQIEKIQDLVESGEISLEQAKQKFTVLNKQNKEYERQVELVNKVADAARSGFDDVAGLLGISSEYSAKLSGFLSTFKEAGFAGGMQGILKGFTSVFNLTNVVSSLVQGLIEQTIKVLELQSDLTAQTGLSANFVNSFMDFKDAANEAAPAAMFLRKEAMEMGAALATNLPIFTTLGQGVREDLGKTGLLLSRLNVDMGDFSEVLINMMEHSGESVLSAAEKITVMTEEMLKFGIQPDEAAKSLAKFLPQLAHLGSRGPDVFLRMTKQAKAMNSSLEEMLKITEGFKTFDEAIPRVNKLNAVFMKLTGTSNAFFDAQKLVNAVTEEDQYNLIAEGVQKYGLSLKDLAEAKTPMARHALNALNDVMGTSNVSELIKQFGSFGKSLDPVNDKAKTLEQVVAEATSPMQIFQAILDDMFKDGTIQEIAGFVRELVTEFREFLKANPEFIKNAMLALGAFGTGAAIAEGAMDTIASIVDKFVTIGGTFGATWAGMKLAAGGGMAAIKTAVLTGLASIGKAFLAVGASIAAGFASFFIFDAIIQHFDDGTGKIIASIASLIIAAFALYAAFTMGLSTIAQLAAIGVAVGAASAGVKGLFGTTGDTGQIGSANMAKDVQNFYEDGGGMASVETAMAVGGTVGNYPTVALVGERGPEIVTLPPRSSVLSNADSSKISAAYEGGTPGSTERLKNVVNEVNNTNNTSNANVALSGELANKIAGQIVGGLGPMLKEIVSAVSSAGQAKVYLNDKEVGAVMYDNISTRFKKEQKAVVFGGMRK